MKQYIFLTCLLSITIQLSAQEMSIEFSIEWKDKLDFTFKEIENRGICPAFLNITYRNISNKPLYCLKITDGKADLPEILYFYDFKEPPSEKLLIVSDNYFKRKYFVGFKSMPDYNMPDTWNIRNDTTDIEYKIISKTRKHPICDICYTINEDGSISFDETSGKPIGGDTATLNDWLSSTLNNIYNFIYHHYYPAIRESMGKDGKEQWYHDSSDIVRDTIMNNSINKFVFLKPGETFVDKYNLIGFQITGGKFTFQLDDTKSLDYVNAEPVYKDESKTSINYYLRKQLPSKVGEYELFTGNFLTNQVIVQFPNIN